MIQDIDEMRNINAGSGDDLAMIRKMVYRTDDNVNHHIEHVGGLREELNSIAQDRDDYLRHVKNGNIGTLENRKSLILHSNKPNRKPTYKFKSRSKHSSNLAKGETPSIAPSTYSKMAGL